MEEGLITDLMVLQSHLDGLLDRMRANSITLRRFQMFEMGLLNLNSLAEMLEYILKSQDFFDLDYIGFCLIGEEIDRAQRRTEALSCFFLDLDNFKKINDTYGHQIGDQVLMVVARVIREQVRNNDVLVRYGGEEFIALLANIEESMAQDIAERIRKKVKELAVETKEGNVSVTISIGSVTYKPTKGKHLKSEKVGVELIKRADEALYSAKDKGRDRVVSAGIISDKLAISNLSE